MSTPRIGGSLADLPDYGYGPTALGWWGTLGFVLIEGMAFVLGAGALLYLLPEQPSWPPASPPPDLLWGTLFTVIVLVSEIPNVWVARASKHQDLRKVRIGLVIAVVIGLALMVVRAFEFGALNERWDHNAYGSIVWALMLMHTVHVLTDVYDTGVLAVLTFTHPVDGRRFSDVEDNAFYWHFVTLAWLALYVLIYLLPRFVG
jgi:heme/copper-type cytochrome/quinol oxidase subunit 3